MRLTFLGFGCLMDTNFRREPPKADGFPTKQFQSANAPPLRWQKLCGSISEVRSALSQPFFRSSSIRRLALVVPRQGRLPTLPVRSSASDACRAGAVRRGVL